MICREPDFHNIKVGSRVLTKQKNNMWHRSIVLKLPEKAEDEYRVKFESSGKIVEASLQDILPLGKNILKINYLCIFYIQFFEKNMFVDDTNLEMSDTSDDSDDDEDANINNDNSYINDQLIHKSLLTLQSNESLGNWEKYTRGIGSKLMIQMGYVIGTGLGKRSDGRIEPIEAQVLPARKSLGLFKFLSSCNMLLTYFIFQITAWKYENLLAMIKICFPRNVKCVDNKKN